MPDNEKKFPRHATVTVGPPNSEGKDRYCKVEPSEVRVGWGGTVTFKCAQGCGPLEIFVPTPNRENDLFPRSGRVLSVPRAGRGKRPGKGRTFTVAVRRTDRPHFAEYPYAVYCRGCNCFGKGSLPRMMIGP